MQDIGDWRLEAGDLEAGGCASAAAAGLGLGLGLDYGARTASHEDAEP